MPPPQHARAQTVRVLRDPLIRRRLWRTYQEAHERDSMSRLDSDAQPILLRLPKLNHLDPYVVRRVTRELLFKPSVYLFSSNAHHQVPRYFHSTQTLVLKDKTRFYVTGLRNLARMPIPLGP